MSIELTKEKKSIIENIHSAINKAERIVISTHQNPDGDAIGSTIALNLLLKKLNKNSRIIINGPIPYNFEFLKGIDDVEIYKEEKEADIISADLIIIVDLNDVKRTKSPAEAILKSEAKKIVIDHHIEPKEFADLYFIETEATSAGELVYHIINEIDRTAFDESISSSLYAAIMTDTGSFRFPRTDGNTHRIIADLIDFGANPVDLFEEIYNNRPERYLKLLAKAFRSIEIFDSNICIMTLRKVDFLELRATNEDVEDIVEQSMTIDNVNVGILLSESLDSEEIRSSFRSKGDISVRDIAAKFNGGGHKNAAGARFPEKSIDDVKALILSELGIAR